MVAETAETTQVSDRRSKQLLSAVMFLAPCAWGLQLMINYSITPTVCGTGKTWLLHLVSLLAALTALGGTLLARASWMRLPSGSTEEGGAYAAGRRFLALAGMGLSLFFVLAIFAAELPNWWLTACQR